MLTRSFKIGMNAGHIVTPVIHVNQYDHDEQWIFTLVDDNGVVYTPSTGGIVGLKADGNVILNAGTVNSSGQVVINETQQMTAAPGDATYELLLDNSTHGCANFTVRVEPKPGDNATYSDSDLSLLQEAIDSTIPANIEAAVQDWMDDNLAPSQWVIDNTLSIAGAAADAKKTGDGLNELKTELQKFSGLTKIQMQGTNQFIKTNLAVGATVNTTPQTSADFKYAIVPCSAGDKFLINATGGGSPRVWCFTDENYAVISVDPTNNHTVSNLVLTAPSNSAYLILNDKSGSISYIGTDRMTEAENDINTLKNNLNKYTGGEYVALTSGVNLNTITTPGNYYTPTSAIASSAVNSPLSVPFNLNVKLSLPSSTTRVTQTMEPCYGFGTNSVRYVRVINISTSNATEWKSFATTDTATTSADGLMSFNDKVKLNKIAVNGNLGNIFYPSVLSNVAELLNIEKTYCILHDNFHRADNSTDIGFNGSGSFKMQYTDMASSTIETQNIAVGINSNKAKASNPYSVSNALRFKIRQLDSLPYKVSMSFDGTGVLVISPVDTSNFIAVRCTANTVSVEGVGSVICTASSVEHNGNVSQAEVYVYADKICVYVAGEKLIETDATPVNRWCGMYFSASETNTIAYTDFNLFLPTENIPVNIDNAIENCGSPSSSFLGFMAQADPTYGITFNSSVTNHSNKSIRFEQRKADSMGGTYRSEITPPYMRTRNYNLQTKILSYDMYLPADYDYDSTPDVLWQMHHTPDGINPDAMYPNIAFGTYQNKVRMTIRSYAGKAVNADDVTTTVFEIADVDKETWHHYDVFIREGYEELHHPCIALFVDGEPKVLTRIPNCYNTTEGSYFKIGMYKSAWTTQTTETTTRTVYYDNLNIWQ